ncbi:MULTISPECIES: MFS transporter [Brevibacillus]|uniref:MFS transporter n=1 Tax=Brevibacillus parabrevis TaxID=54914 RepID=A0A4Y3PM23_BREPA|nr:MULTISPECIES: MFS transporter [Brevibacillus]MBU8712413.1 MFS transporter [Brevibacillus parabrevis]RNB96044.1 MFS transporter [Brevibacillus parabrevis]UED71702.1 MFS transporter [Brevibacillus sp. HD3.3A]GEB32358.1 MFS transporter [Brevibacillus parabrevis]
MKKHFWMIFATVLVAMTSIATFNPILGLLARTLGFSEIQSGSLVTITGLFWIVGSFLWEKWSRTNRKRLMVIAILGYTLTLASFALLADWAKATPGNAVVLYWELFALRAVGGFFFGAIPTMAQGYLMEWTTAQNRASGMALFGGASGMGFVLGPALGAALTPIGFTSPMYVSTALLVAVAILSGIILPDSKGGQVKKAAVKLSMTDPRIRLYILIGLLLSTVMIMLQVTCGIYMQDQLQLSDKAAAQSIGVGLSVAGVIVVVVQLLVGRYLRWQPARLLKIGLSSLFVAFTLFMLAPAWYIVAFLFHGIGIGFTLPGYITAASLAVSAEEQSAVASYTGAAQGVGSFVGPLAGTMLYSWQMSIPYLVCSLSLACVALLVFAKHRGGQPASVS